MGKGYAVPIFLLHRLMGTLRFAHPTLPHTCSELPEIKPNEIKTCATKSATLRARAQARTGVYVQRAVY